MSISQLKWLNLSVNEVIFEELGPAAFLEGRDFIIECQRLVTLFSMNSFLRSFFSRALSFTLPFNWRILDERG